MPTEPPPANQTTAPVPPGQATPNPQHIAQPRQQPVRYQHPQLPHLHTQQYGAAPPRNISQQPTAPQQQQQPPRQGMNPTHPQFFSVNGYPAQMPAYPNQVPPQFNGYVFPPNAYSYNPIQSTSPAQQTAPTNARPRPYSQPAPSQGPPRQTSSRLPGPRKKTILAIVDPDTNEEVKVSKVPPKPAPSNPPPPPPSSSAVKIPPRTSHALELVNDPEDSNDNLPTSSDSAAMPHQVVQPDASTEDSNVVPANTGSVNVTPATQASRSQQIQTEGKPSVASASAPDSATPSLSQPTPVVAVESSASTRVSNESSADTREQTRVANPATSAEPNLAQTSSTAPSNVQSGSAPLSMSPNTSIPATESNEVPAPSLHVESASVEDDSSALHHEHPLYQNSDRYVYAPQWMMEMRSSANMEAAAKYEIQLLQRSISSKSPGNTGGHRDPRRAHGSRGSAGSLSGDPRGMRAFPPQGNSGFQHVSGRGSGAPPPGMAGGGGVGSYDTFDFHSARSKAPPPASKSAPGRDGDPRGTRSSSGGRGGRFDGPNRYGQGPLDPFITPQLPVEKLKKSDKGWKRDKEADDEVTSKVKQVRSLLNKLTLEKFDKIFKQIIDIDISSLEVLRGVVVEVFEKTLFEPKFSGMYAELCLQLDIATKEMLQRANFLDAKGSPITFRKILLNNCQEEFLRFARSSEESDKHANEASSQKGSEKDDKSRSAAEKAKLSEEEALAEKLRQEEAALKTQKAKRRMLANVKFIGELFLKDLLKESIIHQKCIQRLLTLGIESKEEDVLEALCKLISKTGSRLSANTEAKRHIDGYFAHIRQLSEDHSLPARIRFMLQDLIEQRANGWKVRREEAGAKTIAEIHKDIEKEERAKAEAQAAVRERKNRGGGSHIRERGSSVPHVAMTMPMAKQKSNSSMSRSAMLMERVSKNTTGMSPTISMHLGPGGAKLGGSGATGGSLRPNSRFGAFTALADNRESSTSSQSGDARRLGRSPKWSTNRGRAESRPVVSEQKKESSAAATLDPDVLKRKTIAIVKEYFEINDFGEVRACLEEEIHEPNYAKFAEEALKVSLGTKVSLQDKCVSLIVQLFGKVIPEADFRSAFSVIISQLSDIEMDDPRAPEFMARYLGNTAAGIERTDGKNMDFGLSFMRSAIESLEDGKRITKLIVMTYRELYKALTEKIADEVERKAAVLEAYELLGIDLRMKMRSWNAMRGLNVLHDMLKDMEMEMLAPLVKFELSLREVLHSKGNAGGVKEVLSQCKKEELKNEHVVRVVIGVALEWLFLESEAERTKERFREVIAGPIVEYCEVTRDVQMGILLEAQRFFAEHLDTLGSRKEAMVPAFDAFYDSDLVDEDTLLSWKEDTGESIRIEGKDKMIIQTLPFFKWLAEAEVEDG